MNSQLPISKLTPNASFTVDPLNLLLPLLLHDLSPHFQ